MKTHLRKILALMLAIFLLLSLSACGKSGKDNENGSGGADSSDSQTEPAAPDAEKAMENFVKKLTAGNYVIDAPDYVKTSVVSPELVLFTMENPSGINYAFVTLNNETFEGDLEEDQLVDVGFVAPGNAIDAVGFILPNDWIVQSEGNMFNLFYNTIDAPLEFTSYEDSVKTTLLGLAGYGEYALTVMEEVHMILDAEDPTSVHFTAKMGETGTMIHYDDLDLTLEFGTAVSDPRVDAWLKDPVYPPTRTYWTESDIGTLDLVFFRGYGEVAVPFPSFASYALIFDDSAYEQFTMLLMSDAHATTQDVDDYIALLLEQGYEAVEKTLSDGSTAMVYRLLLRDEYRCYAELIPYYDNGLVLEGSLYYDEPSYDSLASISAAVEEEGFAPLDETDVFSGWNAVDTAASRSEGWAYFFNYDMYLQMMLTYTDFDSAKAYLEAYGAKLVDNGFVEAYTPGEDTGNFTSTNEFTSFKYTFNEDDTVLVEFKKEKNLTPEEVKALISAHGIPEADIHGDIGARDHTGYYYEISGFTGLHVNVYQPFDTVEEAEAFLDDYVAYLDEFGYYMFDPQKLGSQRNFLYFNEEEAKYVAFDLNIEEEGATVFFEFVSIEPDEDVLQSTFGK